MEIKDFVICTVRNIVSERGYMFARNGDAHDIMCHIMQGVRSLIVTPDGQCVEGEPIHILPKKNDKVALVRVNSDPSAGRDYTKARLWVPFHALQHAKIVLERMNPINKVAVRAIAVSHRVGTLFTKQQPEVLFEGTIEELQTLKEADLWSLRGIHNYNGRNKEGKPSLLSYLTMWEMRRGGEWTNCGSLVAQTGLIDEREVMKLLPK